MGPGGGHRPLAAGGRAPLLFIVITLAYAIGSVLSWQLFGDGLVPTFFTPAGVTVAAMILTPRSRWPLIIAGIVIAEMGVDIHFGTAPPLAAGYALANLIEPVLGAAVTLALCGGPPDLRQRRGLAGFVLGACVVGPLVGGVIGGSVIMVASNGELSDLLHWWSGDGVGVLVVATPILLWSKQSYVLRTRPVESTLTLLAAVAVSLMVFTLNTPPTLLLLPLLAWSAFRLDVIGAALVGSIIALIANYMTVAGLGPFAGIEATPGRQLASTQGFIAVIVLVAIFIAQEVAGRTAAISQHAAERRMPADVPCTPFALYVAQTPPHGQPCCKKPQSLHHGRTSSGYSLFPAGQPTRYQTSVFTVVRTDATIWGVDAAMVTTEPDNPQYITQRDALVKGFRVEPPT
jgi:integral membrane sensor domain MASE1